MRFYPCGLDQGSPVLDTVVAQGTKSTQGLYRIVSASRENILGTILRGTKKCRLKFLARTRFSHPTPPHIRAIPTTLLKHHSLPYDQEQLKDGNETENVIVDTTRISSAETRFGTITSLSKIRLNLANLVEVSKSTESFHKYVNRDGPTFANQERLKYCKSSI